jgi:hypothetical protein
MADGFFSLQSMTDTARVAEATPSDYIGIVTERAFSRFPGAERLRYVRGSSGFAGFCRGGVNRSDLTAFHKELSVLVGEKRFREWGTEQCASNFAVANSPNALVLPYPEYASFGRPIPLDQVKLFHFIGATRFNDGYYVARGLEMIEKLRQGDSDTAIAPVAAPAQQSSHQPSFAAALSPGYVPKYLLWQAAGRKNTLNVSLQCKVQFDLRGDQDHRAACEIFSENSLRSPVWIPFERINLIVDLGVGPGFSCLYWLAQFPEANIIAFEPRPEARAQCVTNVAMNKRANRIEIVDSNEVANVMARMAGRTIDILRLDSAACGFDVLFDERFAALEIKAVVLVFRDDDDGNWEKIKARLKAIGYRLQPRIKQLDYAVLWAFRATFPAIPD